KTPFPSSEDLERTLLSLLSPRGYEHHRVFKHPRTKDGFEFDFFHEDLAIAMEIMGYRADDEVYKDILKFHVHNKTRFGAVWVPRWKWISGKKTPTNYNAAKKALAFADSYMDIDALVLVPYDWETLGENKWALKFCES
ncbi:MAG: hypothetical protein P1V97_26460, partial [Planctomycetota bacterium]|nr:hypothetical protein [Planctomycetota bacterium]